MQSFCRFCNCTKDQLAGDIKKDKVSLRTKKGYNNDTKCIDEDSIFSSVYGIKTNSCFHQLKYYVVNRLTPTWPSRCFRGNSGRYIFWLYTLLLQNQYIFIWIFKTVQLHCFSWNVISGQNFKIEETVCDILDQKRMMVIKLGGCSST